MTTPLTHEEEYRLVYQTLLDNVKYIDEDPDLSEFSSQAHRELAEFQENYPELVQEFSHMNPN